MLLVVANGTDSLFTHSALIGISGRLVVMRIRNETGDSSENGKRFDFEMGCVFVNVGFVHGDHGVIFFVDIEVFD